MILAATSAEGLLRFSVQTFWVSSWTRRAFHSGEELAQPAAMAASSAAVSLGGDLLARIVAQNAPERYRRQRCGR